ncbi:MAG: hypothetical protein ACRED4_04655, partial [Brevundimonas sp.]
VYPDLEYCDDPVEAAAIIRRHASPAEFEAASDRARQYAMERFDMAAVLPAFESFLKSVASKDREEAA